MLTKDDYRRIALRIVKYGMKTQLVADQFNGSRRRVQQIAKDYRETGRIPVPRRPGPKSKPNNNLRKQVISAKNKIGRSQLSLESTFVKEGRLR